MKVECVSIIDPETGSQIKKNAWLTVGKCYEVLSVFIADGRAVEYRLMADDGHTPGMYDVNLFEVSCGRLPPNWIAVHEKNLFLELSPKSWAEPGFWERYFEKDPSAIEEFEREREVIISAGKDN